MINTPFNYTGSKFKLLEKILPFFDYDKKYFIDVFTGGGSVYTNVAEEYEKILANDIITDLIKIHEKLVNNPDEIIKDTLKYCVSKEDSDGFLKLRQSYNKDKSPEKLWALMLCCTNNMMRFNKKLEFNQTFGKRTFNTNTKKKINEFVEYISKYKHKIYFCNKNFYELEIKKPSMVYFDPPYMETEAGYNAYWSRDLDSKLYDFVIDCSKKNSIAISGLYGEHKNGKRSKLIDDLLSYGFKYEIINYNYEKVARNKNSKNSKEILIYKVSI